MNFFQKIKNSVYSPSFYSSVPESSLGSAMSYFFLIILILTLIQTLGIIKPLLVDTEKQIQSAVQIGISYYPKDLVIKINNGKVTTNTQAPYFIPISQEETSNFLVIDTKTPFSANQFNQYNTFAWLTADSIFYKSNSNNSGEIKAYDLTKITEFTLDKGFIDYWIDKFTPYIKYIGPVLLAFAFVGIYIFYILRLLYLFFLSFLVWLLAKAFHKNLTYGESYKVSLYALTLPLVIEVAINLSSHITGFNGFPFMTTILALVIVLINYFIPSTSKSKV